MDRSSEDQDLDSFISQLPPLDSSGYVPSVWQEETPLPDDNFLIDWFGAENDREKSKKEEGSSSKQSRGSKKLLREIICQYFHMPMVEAAKALNVSLSYLRKRCRKVGIGRWPRHPRRRSAASTSRT